MTHIRRRKRPRRGSEGIVREIGNNIVILRKHSMRTIRQAFLAYVY